MPIAAPAALLPMGAERLLRRAPTRRASSLRNVPAPLLRPQAVLIIPDGPSTSVCPLCQNTGIMPCRDCNETGRLRPGGYHKRNPLNMARIVDSKWTALERTFGWRHFRVTQKRKTGKETFLLMVATCDDTIQFWLNAKNLKDRTRWAGGWLQKGQMNGIGQGPVCRSCRGQGFKFCYLCSPKRKKDS